MDNPADISEVQKQLAATQGQLADYVERFKRDRENTENLSLELSKSWSVSLSVANGGGLIALGGALIKVESLDLWLPILPGMWSFAFGIVIAGLLPLMQAKMYSDMSRSYEIMHTVSKFAASGILPSTLEKSKMESKKYTSAVSRLSKMIRLLSYVSCALFSFGVIWPLAVLTFRSHFS